MKQFQFYLFLTLIFLFTFSVAATPDFTYPDAVASSKLKQQRYDKLAVRVDGAGYLDVYGSTVSQAFKHKTKLDANHAASLQLFFAKQLNNPNLEFNKGFAHFEKDGKEYYLKLSSYAASYSYTLLTVATYPEVVTLPATEEYRVVKSKKIKFPKHQLIPNVKDFAVSSANYFAYDEKSFRYGRKQHKHEGQFWTVTYSKTSKGLDSYRYITAHDYKKQALKLGGKLLADEDNKFVIKLDKSIVSFSSYNGSFTLKIIQEESFKQALILTPDAIKTELDKTGKITLDGVYFDFNKATLKPESLKAILSAVALMQRYPDLVISVHGHTDDKGSDTYNFKLSSDRAASVMSAIVAQGIDASRMHAKGHGETDPIVSNDTDEGRAQNRRVELHKESGGEKKAIITIDFIKPIENSVVTESYTYQDSSLGVQYEKPYSQEKAYTEYKGTQKTISYEIINNNKRDTSFSRTAIIKNYENVLELYNAKIVGNKKSTLYFEIEDRGDGKKVYGRIEAYDGSYTIRFLIE